MQSPDLKQMFTKVLPEIGGDITVGYVGYKFALILTIIQDAHHMALAACTTLVCGAVWHYFKALVIPWINKKLKIKDNGENK
jgi:hypothetical protein